MFRPFLVLSSHLLLFVFALAIAIGSPTVGSADEPQADPTVADAEPQTNAERVRQALSHKADVDIREMPLEQAAKLLAKESGVTILIDYEALETYGIPPSVQVSLRTKQMSVRAALNHLLRPQYLTWIVRGDAVEITTVEEAEANLSTRVYNVRALVGTNDTPGAFDVDTLIELIHSIVDPVSWDDYGGPASMLSLRELLVVNQTEQNQLTIKRLLDRLTKFAEQHAADRDDASTKPIILSDPANDAVWQALDKKFDRVSFKDVPLAEAADKLSEMSGVTVLIDWSALEEYGLISSPEPPMPVEPDPFGGGDPFGDAKADPFGGGGDKVNPFEPDDDPFAPKEKDPPKKKADDDDPFGALDGGQVWFCDLQGEVRTSFTADNVTFRETLAGMLSTLELTYAVIDEAIVITVADYTDDYFSTRIYPVHSLLTDDEITPRKTFDELISIITSSVRPEMWDYAGGPGSVEELPQFSALIVLQSEEVHDQLAALLGQLRKARGERADAKNEAEATDDKAMQMRVYFVAGFAVLGAGDTAAVADDTKEIVEIISELIAPASWKQEEETYIRGFRGRIIVRHRASVHREVVALLDKLHIHWQLRPIESAPDAQMPVGGGGFGGGPGSGLGGTFFSVPASRTP